MAKELKVRFQQRFDTVENWADVNPTLLAGEIGVESGTNKFKFGDGKTKWSELPYAGIDQGQLDAIEDNYTKLTPAENVSDNDALNSVENPSKGDIAVIERVIGEVSTASSMTAYMYDGEHWCALDGNYSAENVYFDSNLIMTADIGVQSLGGASSKDLATAGKTLKQVLSMILAQEEAPSITSNPAVTTKLANNTTPGTSNITVEGGSTIIPKWSASLSAGAYKYGPATGITAKTWSVVDNRNSVDSSLTNETSTTSSGTFTSLVLPAGKSYKVSATATYDAAPLAYTNLGEEYKAGNALFDETEGAASIQIAAGSKSDDSPTITAWQQGYYIGSLESDVEITSAILRDGLKNVHKKGSNYAAGTNTWTFTGTQAKFVVAYPATVAEDKGLTGFFNGTSFEEYVGNFTKSTVTVAGADGDITSAHAKDYTVCTWVPAAPFEGSFSFKITLS